MLMRREDLYEYLHNTYEGDYSIGIHGISLDKMQKANIQETINSIMQDGLDVFDGRSINGTVRFFGRLDNPEDKNNIEKELIEYDYGRSGYYILVAIPTIFRTVDGKSLFLGSPNLHSSYRRDFGSTGEEVTTILDEVIMENNENIIKPKYIIGTFKDIDSENIEFVPNEKHISNNGGFVDEDYYEHLRMKVERLLNFSGVDASLFENVDCIDDMKLVEAISKFELERETGDHFFLSDQQVAFILETLQQLFKESIKRHKSNEDEDETNSINFDTTGRNR